VQKNYCFVWCNCLLIIIYCCNYQILFMKYHSILSRHIGSLLRNTDIHKKEIHRNFTKALHSRLRQCRDILTSPSQISIALLHLNKTLEQEGWDLAEGIQNIMENDAVILKEELTVDGFMSKLDHRKPIFDEGVSPIHGKYTHAIQQYIVEHHLGNEAMKEIFDLIRIGPVEQCEFDQNRKWTLWDEVFDRPAPLTIPNCKRQSVRDAMTSGVRANVMVPPCLDGRSPEWLTTAIALASDHGIPRIHDSVTKDLHNRADNVHEDIFVTGLEDDKYLLLFSPQNHGKMATQHAL